jgi:hypothetical protein
MARSLRGATSSRKIRQINHPGIIIEPASFTVAVYGAIRIRGKAIMSANVRQIPPGFLSGQQTGLSGIRDAVYLPDRRE